MEQQNPIEHLRRHLDAVGLAHAEHRPAVERLADELGPELLAVLLRGLGIDASAASAWRDVA